MEHFVIGQAAIIQEADDKSLIGRECEVVQVDFIFIKGKPPMIFYVIEIDGKQFNAQPKCLSPLPPANTPSKWEDCVWKPEAHTKFQ